tara:strand:- start:732 stop:947 length:216 start_codon:yes stop_codon:yes gene_type:complete
MSFREEVKQRIKEGKEIKVKNPLCSKRLVVKNLKQIRQLLDEEYLIHVVKERIDFLINQVENTDKLDAGKL